MADWHYMKNGVQTGPVSAEELQSLLTTVAIPSSTMVWREGLAGWAPANTLPEFSAVVPAAVAVPPPPPGAPLDAASDVEKNKVFGVLAYIGLLVLVPLLAAKESPFARYHTNQGLVLFLSALVSWIALWIVDIILAFIPVLGWILIMLLNLGFFVGILALAIIGIINASKGICKPLPIIGHRFTLLK